MVRARALRDRSETAAQPRQTPRARATARSHTARAHGAQARGGPNDTMYLFDQFLTQCRQAQLGRPVANFFKHPSLIMPKKVLVLGSGGLSIGQAGEFDYSGSQALKAYTAMGIETVLLNPNIATIQTSRGLADSVYYLPANAEYVQQVILREKPDAIALSFGGQTALNTGLELHDSGFLAKHNVRVLGTTVESVRKTEDRDLFVENLTQIGEPVPVSIATDNVQESIDAARKIGYPVICRAAFALGGLGSGFCENEEELVALTSMSFTKSPQILVERDLRGWKEVEYEVVRDGHGNCITVCNMENFDPLGIHTGDSIVIAPSQTLTNDEYHLIRTSAIKIASHLGIIGECNVQYALHPESLEYAVIEANPRLSRSSALASKATGYPLAAVGAQLSLNVALHELVNPITSGEHHSTSAFFEPSLDYCVVKFPRWDTTKFEHVSNLLGSSMKAVGEVMSIGRNFEEAMQKAIRMVADGNEGFEPGFFPNGRENEMDEMSLKSPTPNRIFAIANRMYSGEMSVDDVHEVNKIDKWYLTKLQNIVDGSKSLEDSKHLVTAGAGDGYDTKAAMKTAHDNNLTGVGEGGDKICELLRNCKEMGFSDAQIAKRWEISEMDVRALRVQHNVLPAVKQIDTLGGEYPATSNYLYTTYNGRADDVRFDDHGVLVIGSGTYRIGSSVEFDYCSVKAVHALARLGKRTIMINNNPETVSTDFDENDRLYFDELSLEKVLDIYEKEAAEGIVVSVGGQAPNNIALKLHNLGANVLGTHPSQIDRCEDRSAYSAMLDELEILQPAWVSVTSNKAATDFCAEVGYPVIVRPSYVLSGAAMNVVHNEGELTQLLTEASSVSPDYPVVCSQFIAGAYEIDMDAVATNGEIVAFAISEHLERGGVHSGDATLVLPSFRLSDTAKDTIRTNAAAIAKELNISGPFNTQFLVRQDEGKEATWVGVIETNLRASRSVPFVAKVLDVDFIDNATRAIMGIHDGKVEANCQKTPAQFGVKVSQFSFQRLLGSDPVLGVEMHSTGEVACFGNSVEEAYLKGLISTHFKVPKDGSSVMVCAREGAFGSLEKAVAGCKHLQDQGFSIVAADEESSRVLSAGSVSSTMADAVTISKNKVGLVIDLSDNHQDFYPTRRNTIDFSIPLITNHEQVILFSRALEETRGKMHIRTYDDYYPEASA